MSGQALGWGGIARLGVVQAALGAVVALATSTLNRVMVVELALPAIVPGALVALHYAVQVLRPRLGHGGDRGRRHTPWIAGGMILLALGGAGGACAVATMPAHPAGGLALALLAYAALGVGVSAAGTNVLALAARRVAPQRQAPAATALWAAMIAGIAVAAGLAGRLLDPFSPSRLMAVVGGACLLALLLSLAVLPGLDDGSPPGSAQTVAFRAALRAVWADLRARRFAQFVFVAMLAYSAQELVLEPFLGSALALSPGQSTALNGVLHGGALAGMLLVAAVGVLLRGRASARGVAAAGLVAGCAVSAAAVLALALAGLTGAAFPLRTTVVVLGMGNGTFAVSALGAMMNLAGAGGSGQEGVRLGVWGAAQALAFGLGGLLGPGASDLARIAFGSPAYAYAAVFAGEAVLFLAAAQLALSVFASAPPPRSLLRRMAPG